ncbi:MAG: DUF4440 domain-containing protein [Alphaproteobacteria bacterium]|nr:DUF4440 domain-containing protein [Alphaproteobacteria bacterium]
MKLNIAISAAALLSGLAACARAPTPAPIVEAERAFAADGYARGVKASFLKTAADDAVMFAPGPVNARQTLAPLPDLKPGARHNRLSWWPRWAGVARSGELGFTTGPYAVNGERQGYYFTIWRKQPDGAWKWELDAGVGADSAADSGPDSEPVFMPLGARGSGSADAAMNDVRQKESGLADAASKDLAGAYADYLADDARLHDEGAPPAIAAQQRKALLDARGATAAFSPLGGGASAAGDFVWTYGEASWPKDNGKKGWYVRVWQKRDESWRIVFDELVPAPDEKE